MLTIKDNFDGQNNVGHNDYNEESHDGSENHDGHGIIKGGINHAGSGNSAGESRSASNGCTTKTSISKRHDCNERSKAICNKANYDER